jgi:hypothetical protein
MPSRHWGIESAYEENKLLYYIPWREGNLYYKINIFEEKRCLGNVSGRALIENLLRTARTL